MRSVLAPARCENRRLNVPEVKIGNFLFDVSGVLVEWRVEPLYMDLFNGDSERFRYFFANVFTIERQREICRGKPFAAVLEELVGLHPDYSEAVRAWDERWDEMVIGPIEGTVRLARALRSRGFGTYLLGNWSREEFDRARRRFDFLAEFAGAVIAGDHGVMKPDHRLFAIALEQFELEARSTVFVDDTAANVAAATALGFEGVLFESPEKLRRYCEDRGWLGD